MHLNSDVVNLSPLKRKERVIVCKMIDNYLGIKSYKIPYYIKILFKHYCLSRIGGHYHRDPGFVSFKGINDNVKYKTNIFDNFRIYFFKDNQKNIISPEKVNKIFVNCKAFLDQDGNKWTWEDGEWEKE